MAPCTRIRLLARLKAARRTTPRVLIMPNVRQQYLGMIDRLDDVLARDSERGRVELRGILGERIKLLPPNAPSCSEAPSAISSVIAHEGCGQGCADAGSEAGRHALVGRCPKNDRIGRPQSADHRSPLGSATRTGAVGGQTPTTETTGSGI